MVQYTSGMAFASCPRYILSSLPTIHLEFGWVPSLTLLNVPVLPKDYVVFLGPYCIVSLKAASDNRVVTIDAANGIFDRLIVQFDQPNQRIGLCKSPNFSEEIFKSNRHQMRAMVRGMAEAIVRT